MAFPYRLSGGALRPDAISGLSPEFQRSLLALYSSAPPEVQRELGLTSGYRSKAVQQKLFDASDRSGKRVAAPGKSRHNFGEAVDLSGFGLKGGGDSVSQATRDYVTQHAGDYGLELPMSYEPWHLQMRNSAPQQGPGAPSADPNQKFIELNWPQAVRIGQMTGVDPRIVISQAALESNYGKSAPGNNYFGIKGAGPSAAALPTKEAGSDGKLVSTYGNFATYDSPEAGWDAYGKLIMGDRYKPVREAKGVDAQIAALGQSGYATDPDYASKISKIALGIPEGGYSYTGAPAAAGGAAADTKGRGELSAAIAQPKPKSFVNEMGDALLGMQFPKTAGFTGTSALRPMGEAPRADAEAVAPVTPLGGGVERRQALAQLMANLNSGRLFG